MAKTRIIVRRTKPKYKSRLEQEFHEKIGDIASYETTELTFIKAHKYYPDFTLSDTKYIETKGYFDAEDRAKHLLVKEQHPEKEVLFVFYNSKNKLNKKSKTTYADWCDKHGFRYIDIKQEIPAEWKEYASRSDNSDSVGRSKVSRRAKPGRARPSSDGRTKPIVRTRRSSFDESS